MPAKKYFTEKERLEAIKLNSEKRRRRLGIKPRGKKTKEEKKEAARKSSEKQRRKKGMKPQVRKYFTEEERKEAKRLKYKEWYKNNPEKVKEHSQKYYKNNKNKVLKSNKNYRENNKEKEKLRHIKYRKENPEKRKESQNKYHEKNRDKINEQAKIYNKTKRKINHKKRYTNDNLYKLKMLLSGLMRNAFKNRGFKKNTKTIKILCCTPEQFKEYLENKFELWMSWENHGKYNKNKFNYGWDIDHIIPLATAKTEEDVIRLNHYTNLQPLCSKVNRDIKKNKLTHD